MKGFSWIRKRTVSRFQPAERRTEASPIDHEDVEHLAKDEDYPKCPPPPPQELLDRSSELWPSIQARKYAAPRGCFEDQPLFTLYRLYECFVLDKVTHYRNQLEYFWRRHQWLVHDIPDPQDSDSARYAFLAGVTYLIARAFNARVKIGLTRDARHIMSMEEVEKAKQVPDELRPYEKPPEWATRVPPLEEPLRIPTEDGTVLESKDDSRADPDFLSKNILLWTPHIHFT